jgi:hypothetical protein
VIAPISIHPSPPILACFQTKSAHLVNCRPVASQQANSPRSSVLPPLSESVATPSTLKSGGKSHDSVQRSCFSLLTTVASQGMWLCLRLVCRSGPQPMLYPILGQSSSTQRWNSGNLSEPMLRCLALAASCFSHVVYGASRLWDVSRSTPFPGCMVFGPHSSPRMLTKTATWQLHGGRRTSLIKKCWEFWS